MLKSHPNLTYRSFTATFVIAIFCAALIVVVSAHSANAATLSSISDDVRAPLRQAETESSSQPTANTTALLTSTPNLSVKGEAVSLMAVITSDAGTPNGTVNFYWGGLFYDDLQFTGSEELIGSAELDANGAASLSWMPQADVICNTMFATYEGNDNFSASVDRLVLIVTSDDQTRATNCVTATALTFTPTSSIDGPAVVSMVATTTSAADVAPNGPVKFYWADPLSGVEELIGSSELDGNGVASLSLELGTDFTRLVIAKYEGNNVFHSSESYPVEPIMRSTTTTVLTSAPNPLTEGQAVSLTATISSDAGAPSGSMKFYWVDLFLFYFDPDPEKLIGNVELDGNGVAALSLTVEPDNTSSVIAKYEGNNLFRASESDFVEPLIRSATTTVLSSTPISLAEGQAVSLTATIRSDSGTPSGSVKFYWDDPFYGRRELIDSADLDGSGVASLSLDVESDDTRSVIARYQGDTVFNTSNSQPVEPFMRSTTTTVLTSTPNPPVAGEAVSLSATVTSNVGSPSGSVDFYYIDFLFGSQVSIGTAEIDANGVVTISWIPDGNSITATYGGSSMFESSDSSDVDPTAVVTGNDSQISIHLPLFNR